MSYICKGTVRLIVVVAQEMCHALKFMCVNVCVCVSGGNDAHNCVNKIPFTCRHSRRMSVLLLRRRELKPNIKHRKHLIGFWLKLATVKLDLRVYVYSLPSKATALSVSIGVEKTAQYIFRLNMVEKMALIYEADHSFPANCSCLCEIDEVYFFFESRLTTFISISNWSFHFVYSFAIMEKQHQQPLFATLNWHRKITVTIKIKNYVCFDAKRK